MSAEYAMSTIIALLVGIWIYSKLMEESSHRSIISGKSLSMDHEALHHVAENVRNQAITHLSDKYEVAFTHDILVWTEVRSAYLTGHFLKITRSLDHTNVYEFTMKPVYRLMFNFELNGLSIKEQFFFDPSTGSVFVSRPSQLGRPEIQVSEEKEHIFFLEGQEMIASLKAESGSVQLVKT